jgi:aspartate/methionine/tyrosine aminotransferase
VGARRDRLAQLPEQPDGRGRAARVLLRAAELSREHGFLLACDEAYSELWFDEPPHSALEVASTATSSSSTR